MIGVSDLKAVSRGRLKDALVLQRAGRFDGAVYISGFAVEIALKARACRTLKWSGFPETASEFTALQLFKTHNLEVLLKLSGTENKIRTKFLTEWSVLVRWNPASRYRRIGTATRQDAIDMIAAARNLLGAL
jgi:HEPN domain-containing protein